MPAMQSHAKAVLALSVPDCSIGNHVFKTVSGKLVPVGSGHRVIPKGMLLAQGFHLMC